jgi:peroxiredoxin Q/BCP
MMYGKETEGVIRSTVLIDERGRVAKHWPRVKAEGHAEEVLKALSESSS